MKNQLPFPNWRTDQTGGCWNFWPKAIDVLSLFYDEFYGQSNEIATDKWSLKFLHINSALFIAKPLSGIIEEQNNAIRTG